MNVVRLQARLDQAVATSLHRWVLMFVAVTSLAAPSFVIAAATPFTDTWVAYCVLVLALVVVVEPGEQLGLVMLAIVFFQWLTLDQAVTSPWSMAFAICIYVFHTSVALMAVTPHTASIQRDIQIRWTFRSLVVAAATVGVWLLVVAFERDDPSSGNVALTAMALVVLTVAVVVFQSRSRSSVGQEPSLGD